MQDPRRLNPAEGEQFLEAFRRSGIPQPFAFRFHIQHLPRRGVGFQQSGEMWGVWDGHASSRVSNWARRPVNPPTTGTGSSPPTASRASGPET